MTNLPLNICVFSGARPGKSDAIATAANETGSLIGHRGHRLVYGGGGSGLMGSVAWAASRNGAEITGIIPKFIFEREQAIMAPPQEMHLTETMFDRKKLMLQCADGFLALPGGYGTLDEVLEVITLNSLGIMAKPLVILELEGIWAGLLQTVQEFCDLGFASGGAGVHFHVASSPAEAMDLLEAHVPAAAAIDNVKEMA
jgi:cytokinin riboside 5'-monophosphate phosphoribohydrolase